MKLMITGGAGFIGSALVLKAIAAGHEVLTIDDLTYAGRLDALDAVSRSTAHHFLRADIADAASMEEAFDDFEPDAVINLAAETHVDRSIDGPLAFVETNVVGTCVLLAAAQRYWTQNGHGRFLFLHVSTDEVFGSLGETGIFRPDTPYRPNSPYAASKAASDHFTRAWHATYGLPVTVTHCSNNFGPRQHSEKLIPTVIRHALAGAPIPIYGTGTNIRDWLYVDDHAGGLLLAVETGGPGETYLFGGRNERTNLTLARSICRILDEIRPLAQGASFADQIAFVPDRPGHDFRYAVDPAHAAARLGWQALTPFETGLRLTVEWYLARPDWLAPIDELGRLGLAQTSQMRQAMRRVTD